MSEARYYWQDFPVGRVREFGVAVTDEEIVRFARQFDPQPFHLDEPHLGLVRNRWEILNQHGDPVMEMIGSAMLLRRPAG